MSAPTTTRPPVGPPPRAGRPRRPAPRRARRSGRRTPWPTAQWLELALTCGALAAAAGPFAGFYASPWWILPVGLGLLLGAGIGVLSAWRRWPGWLVAVVAATALIVLLIVLVHRDSTRLGLPTGQTVQELRAGLISGWLQMLTVAVPADPAGELLTWPVLLTFTGGLVTALLVLRTRAVLSLVLAPLVVLVAGLVAGATHPRLGTAATAVMLGLLLAVLLIRGNRLSAVRDGPDGPDGTDGPGPGPGPGSVGLDEAAGRRHSLRGRVLVGLPVIALIGVGAIVLGLVLPIAPGTDRADPRALVAPSLHVVTDISPLVEVRPQLTAPTPTPLFRVTVEGPTDTTVQRIRIAALDSFDGALWSQNREFRQAGSTLPEVTIPLKDPRQVTLRVEVLKARNAFLPVIGQPVATVGVDTAVEPISGTLVSTSALAGTPVPDLTYEVTGLLPTDEDKSQAIPAADAEFTKLPDLPDDLRQQAEDIVAGAPNTPWARLMALQDYLNDRKYNPAARPGESYAAIERILSTVEADQVGSAQQYASAFAVLARSLGFPTRVAVGYVLDDETGSGSPYTVTTANAHAWPEVLLEGYGWVPFEPTNQESYAIDDQTEVQIDDSNGTPDQQEPAEPDPRAEQGGTEVQPSLADRVLTGLWIALVVVGGVLLLLGGIIAAKHLRRRRRRRHGPPARRIAAAWDEVKDRLREAGHPAAASRTPLELAAIVDDTWSGPKRKQLVESLTELAVVVTNAVYDPQEPTPVAARRAWTLHDEIVSSLLANRGALTRLLTLIDPRSLFRREKSEKVSAATSPPAPEPTPETARVAAGSGGGRHRGRGR